MGIKFLLLICLVFSTVSWGQDPTDQVADKILGVSTNEKFTYYEPSYLIFGDEDLKLQFSFKYKLSKEYNLFFAYTQLMFWEIYGKSKPFADVNYRPEGFYRFLDKESSFLKSLDVGYMHLSNGQESDESRSLDRIFLRANLTGKIGSQHLGTSLRVFQIFNEDDTNKDIINHLGYWEAVFFLSDIVIAENRTMHATLRTYAGSKIYDIDKGGVEGGLMYNLPKADFNPSLYLQWFEGYSESLIDYNKRRSEYRFGIVLSY